MKPLILNYSRFLKKMEANSTGKKNFNTNSEKETIQNAKTDQQQQPYYEIFISKHNKPNDNYWDLSGGLIGI